MNGSFEMIADKLIVPLIMVLALTLSGCMGYRGIRIYDTSRSIGEIRAAIKAVAGEPREVRNHQREFVTQYLSRRPGDPNFDPVRSRERMFVRFRILGDRRPYDIEVLVLVEERVDGRYEVIGEDEEMAELVAEKLRDQLTRSREELNVIDDFRPF